MTRSKRLISLLARPHDPPRESLKPEIRNPETYTLTLTPEAYTTADDINPALPLGFRVEGLGFRLKDDKL